MAHRVELWEAVQVAVFAALALLSLRLWRRQGGAAGARMAASFAVVSAAALLLWLLPDTGWQSWAGMLAAAVLLLYPLMVAARLWTGGRALGAVARRRMRMLSVGIAAVVAFVLVGGLIGAIGSLVAAAVVLLGLAPPAVLRMSWRRQEETALRKAELDVMRASTPREVAGPLLEPIAHMLGGEGALLADAKGRAIATYGVDDVVAAKTASRLETRAVDQPSFHDGVLVLPLRSGWLVVHASPYAPFFGGDEIALVQRLGLVIDMALERAESFQADRAARESVEAAHAEMESLLYTVSHDLKSPLLTVLGYIDLLRMERAEATEQTEQFVDRIAASALYMQHLINDLLELSRIGRRETKTEDVELAAVVADVAEELRTRYPSAYVGIGLLPVVTMSAVRARQLVTNLLENAAVHSRRPDVSVEVGAQRRPDGSARLWVADDGRGIPAEHRERVFGVFERFDDRPAGDSGTGIGLAACRKILEHVGGSIRFADVQNGASVEILLPADAVRWQPSAVAAIR